MQQTKPDYKRIYTDLLRNKHPQKREDCEILLNKKELSTIDVLAINKKIFGASENQRNVMNQKLHSYSKSDIFEILDFQKKHKLNNSQLAAHFKLSRNTVAKWKKIFL